MLMTQGKMTDLMFERANTNEPVVLDASSRMESIINLTAVLSHGDEIHQSLSYLSLDWPLLSPLCHDGIAVTRSVLFHPSSTSEGKKRGRQ